MAARRSDLSEWGLRLEPYVDAAQLGRAAANLEPSKLALFLASFCAEVTPRNLSIASGRALTQHITSASKTQRVLTALQTLAEA